MTGFRNPGRYQKKNAPENPPKFNPVSFLMLLLTKDFIMFKALVNYNKSAVNYFP